MVLSVMSTTAVACASFVALWTGSSAECADEVRLRKPWHSLNDDEQMMYVNGFQELARTGILAKFISAHQTATAADAVNIHKSAQNLFWHSYWLWELESAFRNLGEDYECFTIPYWDVTKDGQYWYETENPVIEDIPIYSGNLGGEGDPLNDYCVGEPWTTASYTTEVLCADDEVSPNCCLKRWHDVLDDLDRPTVLYTPEDVGKIVFTDPKYKLFSSFLGTVSGFHGDIHSFFGAKAGTHFCGDSSGAPTYEPLFPVFHTFIEYLRLLHQDCNQFDTIDAELLEDDEPYTYDAGYRGADISMDYVMDYSILCDDDLEWDSVCKHQDITPRTMFDVSPNTQFNVMYELGDFWTEQHELKSMCFDKANTTWWRVRGMELRDGANEQFVSDHAVHSVNPLKSNVAVGTMVFMAFAVAVMALLRLCGVTRKKKVDRISLSGDATAYGTV